MPLGQLVHAGAGGAVGRVLLSAVQHDDQGNRRTGVARRDVEVVVARTGGLRVAEAPDLAAGRGGRRRRGRAGPSSGCRRQAGEQARQLTGQSRALVGGEPAQPLEQALSRRRGAPPGPHPGPTEGKPGSPVAGSAGPAASPKVRRSTASASVSPSLPAVQGSWGAEGRAEVRSSSMGSPFGGREDRRDRSAGAAGSAGSAGRNGQVVRSARAALTSLGARKAPSTSTAAMVARASSGGDVVGDRGEPEDPQLDGLAGGPQLLELAAGCRCCEPRVSVRRATVSSTAAAGSRADAGWRCG